MGSASVWIAGSYQSDFARNYAREGLEISDMVGEAVAGTLESARLSPHDVGAVHVGNAFGQLFTGQGQLGAMPATVEPALWGGITDAGGLDGIETHDCCFVVTRED
jgi:acetyl-CoA C-acetyltransferase